MRAAKRRYCQRHPEVIARIQQRYFATEGGRQALHRAQKKYRSNPSRVEAQRARMYVRSALKMSTPTRFLPRLGCTPAELRLHLERHFQRGMTWKNWHSEWVITYARPLRGFNLMDPAERAEATHYTNLRVAWAGRGGRAA